jgi:hypothetical protein
MMNNNVRRGRMMTMTAKQNESVYTGITAKHNRCVCTGVCVCVCVCVCMCVCGGGVWGRCVSKNKKMCVTEFWLKLPFSRIIFEYGSSYPMSRGRSSFNCLIVLCIK